MDIATDHAASLSLARIAIGTGAWVAPEHPIWSTALGAPAQSPYTMRLFAAREVALGGMTLMAPPAVKPSLLKIGIAVDGADAVAGALAARSGAVSKVAGVLLTVMALSGVAAGAAALGQRP